MLFVSPLASGGGGRRQKRPFVTVPSDPANPDQFEVQLDARSLKSTSIRGSMLIGFSQLLRLLMQVGSQVVLARLLFPEDFGLVAMVFPLITFAAIFADIGFGEAVIQRDKLDQQRVSSLFWISIGLSVVLGLIVAGASPLVALVYGDPRLALLTAVVAIGMPIGALGGVQGALLTRHMKYGSIMRIELLSALIGTSVTIAAAFAGWSYWSLAAGTLAQQGAATIQNWIASDWRPSRPGLSSSTREDLHFGGNVTGFNLANFVTQSCDNIIIGLMNGQHALGLYDRSYRLVVQPLGQVLAPIGRIAVPLLSRLNSDPVEYEKVYLAVVRAIVMLTVPGMLVCIVFGHQIVAILLGPRWVEAGEVFSWVSVAGLTSGVQATALWLFISQARMRGLRSFTLTTAFFNLTSFFIGSFWGIVGVAISVGMVYTFVTSPLILYGATRHGPVRAGALLRSCLPFVAAACVAAVLLVGLRRASPLPELAQIIAALSIAYAVFTVAGLAARNEREKLVKMLRLLKKSK